MLVRFFQCLKAATLFTFDRFYMPYTYAMNDADWMIHERHGRTLQTALEGIHLSSALNGQSHFVGPSGAAA